MLMVNRLVGFGRRRVATSSVAIQFIAGAGANGTSITIPGAEQADDLIIIAAVQEATFPSITIPSSPAYTEVLSGNDGTNELRVGRRVATSGSETSGTWSQSDCLAAVLMRGVNPSTPIGNISSFHTTASGSTSFVAPAVTLTSGHGNRNHIVVALYVTAPGSVTWPTLPNFTRQASQLASTTSTDPGVAIYVSDNPVTSDFSDTTSNTDGSFTSGSQMALSFELRAA